MKDPTVSNKKAAPLFADPPRKKCPVCGQTTYSAAGVHPQCCSTRSDATLRALRKAADLLAASSPPVLKP